MDIIVFAMLWLLTTLSIHRVEKWRHTTLLYSSSKVQSSYSAANYMWEERERESKKFVFVFCVGFANWKTS